jgi:WhiB family transcriptional regulator, redox-sensing transcriptional regulator
MKGEEGEMSFEHVDVPRSIRLADPGLSALDSTPQTNSGAESSTTTPRRAHLTLVPDAFGLAPLTPDDPEWQERALCAQTDPEAFFPEKGGSTREAKRICMGCEVRDACLEYALAHDERFGIWGGLSERERRRLKRGII